MKHTLFTLFTVITLLTSCQQTVPPRSVSDFNMDWLFFLEEGAAVSKDNLPATHQWKAVQLPHDWSVGMAFTKVNTGASTGFLPAGVGWYQKVFDTPQKDKARVTSIEFDGVYHNAEVWVNGHYLGKRPYGYSSFSYDLTPYLHYGTSPDTVLVRVGHENYLDSRWYTGSGIYRNVRLVKKAKTHIPQWGVSVATPEISTTQATIEAVVEIARYDSTAGQVGIQVEAFGPDGTLVAEANTEKSITTKGLANLSLTIQNPQLWDIESPKLYRLKVQIKISGQVVDAIEVPFGIRSFRFDANKGFFLNDKSYKLKGVNLHHAAGAVGAAVPIDVWARRFKKLKSIGCNAIRTAHNPVAPEFLDLCDQMGFVVIDEFFDEWDIPKKKSLHKLGDNQAPDSVSRSYSADFNKWAETDLKDCIRRDRNHPSVIMWSIGNEIEWTHPYYSQASDAVNGKNKEYYKLKPKFDSLKIKHALDSISGGRDSLFTTAQKLAQWTRETDPTRPVTCGNVLPSIGLASGYGQTVDVLGFNYRANEYDGAHKAYPNLLIYGSENWGAWSEWKACIERDFVAGIFCWTGFAYGGESGPWPHKGLNISFFDFAGFKTPRGHFFEALWKDNPHIYMGTTPESESEFKYVPGKGFETHLKNEWIRRWAWYDIYDRWAYTDGEKIVVQAYTNCEEAELILNGKSLGKQKLASYETDRVMKWLVPYAPGELKIMGYTDGQLVTSYTLNTPEKIAQIALSIDRDTLSANQYDVAHIEAQLLDKNGIPVTHTPTEVQFDIDGPVKLLGIDNGDAANVQGYQSDRCVSYNGKVLLLIQAKDAAGPVHITATAKAYGAKAEAQLTVQGL